MRFAILAVLAASLFPVFALAHTTGASWNKTVGDYTVDIGYDPPYFQTDLYSRLDFLLWKGAANTGTPVDYEQVWIRILKDKETVLATGLKRQSFGPTTLLYQFATPGNYTIEASYRDTNDSDVAVASMPISVTAGANTSSGPWVRILGAAFAGLVVGFFGALALSRLRARRS